ncbi:MAG: Gfo/Idh/MocA family oxidoreductase [Gemmataceae bacterium]
MSAEKKVRVAIVGLGFGAEFIPIYQAHPNAELVAICRRNKKNSTPAATSTKSPNGTNSTRLTAQDR